MRFRRLHFTDLSAGLLVAGATAIYATGAAGAEPPGLEGVRARAAAIFVFGMLACGAGSREDAFKGNCPSSWLVGALSAVGALTLVLGILAIAIGSSGLLTALMVGTWLLWVGATVRHAVTAEAQAPVEQPPPVRELVKR